MDLRIEEKLYFRYLISWFCLIMHRTFVEVYRKSVPYSEVIQHFNLCFTCPNEIHEKLYAVLDWCTCSMRYVPHRVNIVYDAEYHFKFVPLSIPDKTKDHCTCCLTGNNMYENGTTVHKV